MKEAYIVDAIRTPIGSFRGALAQVRADDLAAIPIKALMDKFPRRKQPTSGFTLNIMKN